MSNLHYIKNITFEKIILKNVILELINFIHLMRIQEKLRHFFFESNHKTTIKSLKPHLPQLEDKVK